MIVLVLHNLPEGIATFLSSYHSINLGLRLSIAIMLHNIPEGIAVALPIYHATGKKRYAMLYAALSGITEPIGALIGVLLLGLFLPQVLVGILMAAVAGIMIYISFDTLLPLAREYGNWLLSMIGIVTGMLFIWLSYRLGFALVGGGLFKCVIWVYIPWSFRPILHPWLFSGVFLFSFGRLL